MEEFILLLAFLVPLLVLAALVLALISLIESHKLGNKIQILENLLKQLSAKVQATPEQPTPEQPTPEQPIQGRPTQEPERLLPPPLPSSKPAPAFLPEQPKSPTHSPSSKSKKRKRLRAHVKELQSREFLTGSRLLGWAGGLILLFGVLYFLRYAIDREWISPLGRILIGTGFGLTLIVGGGSRFLRRTPLFGNLLAGLGLAILYGCLFFAFKLYHLVGMGPSFGGSILLTAFALFLALRWEAEGIAILALIGGFLSPILLSDGEGNFYALFSYLAALDLAFLFISFSRPWRFVGPLSLIGTALMGYLWYEGGFTSSLLTPVLGYLSFFWLLFHSSNSIQIARYGAKGRIENPLFYIGLSFGVFVALSEVCLGFPKLLGWCFLGISCIQLGTLFILQKRLHQDSFAFSLLSSHALSFLFLGIASLFEGQAEVFVWGVMGLSLGLVMIRRPSIFLLVFQLISFWLGYTKIRELHRFGAQDLIYHVWLWNAYGFVLLWALVGYMQQWRASKGDLSRRGQSLLSLGAFLSWALALIAANSFWAIHSEALMETDWEKWISEWRLGGFSLFFGLFLFLASRMKVKGFLVFLGLFILGRIGWEAYLWELENWGIPFSKPTHLYWNPGFVVYLVFALLAWATGWRLLSTSRGETVDLKLALGRTLFVIGFLFAIHVPSLELYRDDLSNGVIFGIQALYFSFLSLLLLFILREKLAARGIWVLGLSLACFYCGIAILVPFSRVKGSILFLNSPFLLSLAALGTLLVAQGRLRRDRSSFFPGLSILLSFFLLILLTRETVSWANSASIVLPLFGKVGEQFGLGLASALWAVEGLVFLLLGLKGKVKTYRLIGMAVFVLVILKVFLFDTSNIKPVFRILSFVASGALLLMGSFAYNHMLQKDRE